jgi:hypothetical protein
MDYYNKNVEYFNALSSQQDQQRINTVVSEELKKHSYITLARNGTTVDCIEKIAEQRAKFLQMDKKDELRRKQVVLNALILVFRSVGKEDWKTCNLRNIPEKMVEVLKLKKQDFRKMILFDPEEILEGEKGLKLEAKSI